MNLIAKINEARISESCCTAFGSFHCTFFAVLAAATADLSEVWDHWQHIPKDTAPLPEHQEQAEPRILKPDAQDKDAAKGGDQGDSSPSPLLAKHLFDLFLESNHEEGSSKGHYESD